MYVLQRMLRHSHSHARPANNARPPVTLFSFRRETELGDEGKEAEREDRGREEEEEEEEEARI